MGIDIVIPLGRGCIWGDNNELLYALRGIEKHIVGFNRLVIVGLRPKWITNIIHIPCDDKQGNEWRDYNIFNKICTAISSVPDLSDDFLFMNDDHFMLQDHEAASFPYYYREEDMIETINKAIKNHAWNTCVSNTRRYLISNNLPVKMFDTHTPILYNKHEFLKLKNIDWNKMYGYCIKSLYANTLQIQGILRKDGKMFSSETNTQRIMSKIHGLPCFSTSPVIPAEQQSIIKGIYTKKSKWEF